MYQKLSAELDLNPKAELPPTMASSALQLLRDGAVDDPDRGIDQDLPDSADPQDYRQWMGGKSGPTSQGFRHMYFGGWKLAHPIETFQVPLHPIGMAPARVQAMMDHAQEELKRGNTAWGFRLLAWTLHYAQDLAQPFHAVQIVSTKMVPWLDFFKEPGHGFVAETTRTIANYHYAFEQYTLFRLSQTGQMTFMRCLRAPEHYSNLEITGTETPEELAHRIAEASIRIAHEIGTAEVALFGYKPMEKGIDLPRGQGSLDYAQYSLKNGLAVPRARMERSTCTALANAAYASRILIERFTDIH